MDDIIILFLGLLAILCQVWLVTLAVLGIDKLRRRRSTDDRLVLPFDQTLRSLAPLLLPLAFAVALTTMLGSLYMSEFKHYNPCRLCWIQRSLLYPQVILTALLWWRPRLSVVRWLSLLLLAIDVPVSSYHYLLEWYPNLETSVCLKTQPCYLVYVRLFHYLSIPFMALTSALTVGSLLLLQRRAARLSAAFPK